MIVINLGRVAMWRPTFDLCRSIPKGKHGDILTTATNYGKDPKLGRCMLERLLTSHEHVYFWA